MGRKGTGRPQGLAPNPKGDTLAVEQVVSVTKNKVAANTRERGMGSPISAGLRSHATQVRGMGSPPVLAAAWN
jgi:hypothetical protein